MAITTQPSRPADARCLRRAGSHPALGVFRAGPGPAARTYLEADRRVEVHRVQGLPSGVPPVERPARGSRLQSRGVRQPHGPHAEFVDRDALHGMGEPADRQSRMADPQGRLHALRRSGLSQGLPGARRHRAVLERHRRLRPREMHRLRLLREGLPLQHPAHLAGDAQGLQVLALLRPRRCRPRPCLCQGLPDEGDRLRHQGGDEEARRWAHRRS